MAVKQKWILGALALYDNYPFRLLDAWGSNVHKYITDYTREPVDDQTGLPVCYTCTMTSVGSTSTVSINDAQGGWLRIAAGSADNDGGNVQLKGEMFKLTAGDPLYFSCRVKLDEATQSDFLIGLVTTNTDLSAPIDGVYFAKADGSAALSFYTEKDDSATSTAAATMAAATEYVLSFFWDGTDTVNGYVNTVLVAAHKLTLPDDEELTVSMYYLNGAAQSSKGLDVDYVRVIQFKN